MHRRHDDVTWRLVIELLDAFAEIRFDHLDAALLEEWTHVAFLGQHGLALDEHPHASRRENVEDDLIVFRRVPRPMNFDAVFRCLALKFLQVIGKMRERVFFDCGSQIAQLFPLGYMMRLAITLLSKIPEPGVMKCFVLLTRDEPRSSFRMIEPSHARAPFRICAIWMNLMSRPRRSA